MDFFYSKYKYFKGIIFHLLLDIKRRIRILLGKNIYYVIGDSHTLNFLHEAFIIKHIGPATAYRLNFEKSTTGSKKKVINILKEIYKNKPINVIFVFGELDARIHIYKVSREKNINIDTLITKTVESYVDFINFVKKQFPLINIYIFNVLPQGEEGNIYRFPYYAPIKKRKEIVEKLNKILQKYSKINKFKFINIYSNLVDKEGKRKKEYVFDDVHFNKRIMPYVLNYVDKLNKTDI